MNDLEKWIVETVDSAGWAVVSVGPREGSDDPEQWWSYSIGLPKTFGWPELICFGLSTDSRRFMINDAVDNGGQRAGLRKRGCACRR